MKTRFSLALGLVLALTPASVAAQAEGSPAPGAVELDMGLVNQLCAAVAADEAERTSCIDSVESALGEMEAVAPDEGQSLLDQAASIVDDTLDDLRAIDVQAVFDEAITGAQDFELDAALADVQEAVDGAVADAQAAIEDLDLEVDVQAALEEAVAEALAATEEFDLQGAVDEALAEAQDAIEAADIEGTVDEAVVALGGAVDDARAVVAEAQQWAQENREAVCRGGSVSVGVTAGLAVFAVTGIEWLGLQAFLAIERFTNAACGDVVD